MRKLAISFIILIFIGITVGACATAEQERAQAAAEAAAVNANDDAICRGYGAAPGTPPYIQCRMNLQSQRAAVAANDRAIALQALVGRPWF